MSVSSDSEDDGPTAVDLFKSELCQIISNVHSTGSFATSGIINSFVNPGISVDPISIVRLPLSEEDARVLIRASQKAPFGKGSQTFVDESVRKTWQIDANKIQLLNPSWQPCLDQIIVEVAKELGIAGGSKHVRAELYKMLLYETAAMFKPHQDTEKAPGMFGTLVICLPSKHTGGAVSLQHGTKSHRFETSERSGFDASYMAWYADVNHEIEAVQTGYRWVLTYNLINTSQIQHRSASILEAQMNEITEALTRWQNLDDAPGYLAYVLGHEYSTENLELARLKGNDYHRARYVAQGCAAHGDFYFLLANIEMCITDRNCEEEEEPESQLSIGDIVDVQGSFLTMHNRMDIPDDSLLNGASYSDREPDTQRGGNYLGNQHAEIDQFFRDSVLIIVPSHNILSFVLGKSYRHGWLSKLLGRLRGCITEDEETMTREILLKTCYSYLSKLRKSKGDMDAYLGPIAMNAVLLEDATLFTKAVEEMTGTFEEEYYGALGKSIDVQDPVMQEHDIIEALIKCHKLYQIHSNLNAFRDGFLGRGPDGVDQIQIKFLKRWLDTLLYRSLHDLDSVFDEDASTIIQIILDREEEPFCQFILFQGIRIFINRFRDDETLTNAIMIELSFLLQYESPSKIYLDTLLQRIARSAICNLDLPKYAEYIESRGSLASVKATEKHRTQAKSANRQNPAGPIGAFYAYVSEKKVGATQLLKRIQAQGSRLTVKQSQDFLPPFLKELLTAVDVLSTEAQQCIHSLIEVFITQTVGQEPEKPSDWARPSETAKKCYLECDKCRSMDEFLKDPQRQHFTLPPSSGFDYHLQTQYNSFKYFDTEGKNKYNATAVLKTTKWWEEQRKEWKTRASSAYKTLMKLPQDELKACLGDKFDEIMDLRMVKIKDEAEESKEHGKEAHEVDSTVPQKRKADD